jgi:hypothetical protein
MPLTYEPIATTTLGSDTSTITFDSIPQTYTDLRVVLVTRSSSSSDGACMRFNSNSSSIYSGTYLAGNGNVAFSTRDTSFSKMLFAFNMPSSASGLLGLATADIFSYAGSTNKTVLGTGSADTNGGGFVSRNVCLARLTAAVTRIDLFYDSGFNFVTGTTATLYGILKA